MAKYRFGLVFDAGSSGTRLYVYRWKQVKPDDDAEDLQRLPKIKTKKEWIKKIRPGISTFGTKPEAVGSEHLKELVDFALDIVPADQLSSTPVYLMATAGMRLLPEKQQSAVLQQVCSYFSKETEFLMQDCASQVQIIPGETEGLYGWIAANYLLGGFDEPEQHQHGKDHHTYGFLDMGGASAQIAFAPNATEAVKHADDLKLLRLRRMDGQQLEYKVFVTTWLGFGANEARRRYVEKLIEVRPGVTELPDPCLPKGLLATMTGTEIEAGSALLNGTEPHLLGTGDFRTCLKQTFPLLEKNKECLNAPCLLNGIHTPAIDFDVNHFVGVSEFWHTTHGPFAEKHKEKAYDLQTYQEQVIDFCSRDWKDIESDVLKNKWGDKVDEKTVEEVCFKASWLINMLHDGVGVPRLGIEASNQGVGSNKTLEIVDGAKDTGFLDPFQAVDKIHGTEVSWTLGKMVLYASSQMPPAPGAMPVGFGANVLHGSQQSDDFEIAGEGFPILLDEDTHWHDRLLASNYQRRVPGVLILLLIVGFVVYLLCGRDRRANWHNQLSALLGRRGSIKLRSGRRKPAGGLFGGKLFSGTSGASPDYARVLEDALDPDEFELSDVDDDYSPSGQRHSDSSTSTTNSHSAARTGRTSGITTPALRGLSPDLARGSPKPKAAGYFDGVNVAGGTVTATAANTSHGLGITPFERGAGLSSRSESKERVVTLGSRSRRGSPSSLRRMPLVTPIKESVD